MSFLSGARMRHADLRSEENLTRETMHIACIYGWISKGWDQQKYGCHIDKSPYPDSGDLIVDQMEASKVVWAMNREPKPINHWLQYAYGDDKAMDWNWHGRMATYVLWGKAFERRDETNYNVPWLAIQDYRRRVIGLPNLAEEVLMATLGGKKWAWEKHWKPKYEDVMDQIQTWDTTGVAHVSITVKALRGERT